MRFAAWIAFVMLFAGGCQQTPLVYEPACIAYSGDRIEIDGDRYVWSRFTDERVIGEDGEILDPTPGYPRRGTVTRNGQSLTLVETAKGPVAEFFVEVYQGQRFLLNRQQLDDYRAAGNWDDCALAERR